MAEECGDAVGDSPSLLMEADNRRDWKKKKDMSPQAKGDLQSVSPLESPVQWSSGETGREEGRGVVSATLGTLKAGRC